MKLFRLQWIERCEHLRRAARFDQSAHDVKPLASSRRRKIVGKLVGELAKPTAHVKNVSARPSVGHAEEVVKDLN